MLQQRAVGVFGHGYTYSGHPLGCAVASKVIDIYVRDRFLIMLRGSVSTCKHSWRHSAIILWWAKLLAWA